MLPRRSSQLAAAAALETTPPTRDDYMGRFRGKVDLLAAGLARINGVSVVKPAGTFYVFPDVRAICNRLGLTSHGLAMYLLEGADDAFGVACLGGECFGAGGRGLPALQLRRARRADREGGGVPAGGVLSSGQGEGVPGAHPECGLKAPYETENV